jgi:hypothetical protein
VPLLLHRPRCRRYPDRVTLSPLLCGRCRRGRPARPRPLRRPGVRCVPRCRGASPGGGEYPMERPTSKQSASRLRPRPRRRRRSTACVGREGVTVHVATPGKFPFRARLRNGCVCVHVVVMIVLKTGSAVAEELPPISGPSFAIAARSGVEAYRGGHRQFGRVHGGAPERAGPFYASSSAA